MVVELGVELIFFPADFMTGDMHSVELPLRNVSMGQSLAAHSFSASLDLRALSLSTVGAQQILLSLLPGRTTIVALEWTPSLDRYIPLGEWLITGRRRQDGPDPVLQLTGVETSGYAQLMPLMKAWKRTSQDPVDVIRGMWQELCTTDQTISLALGGIEDSGVTVDVDYVAGSRTYWDAMRDVASGSVEWVMDIDVERDGTIPTRVTRTIRTGVPTLLRPRDDRVLEMTADGRGSMRSLTVDDGLAVNRVYGFGAGSGKDQITTVEGFTRGAGEPLIGGSYSSRDALKLAQLRRETQEAVLMDRPTARTFTASTQAWIPRLGEVYPIVKDSTALFPVAIAEDEERRVRCIEWSWTRGPVDEYQMTLQIADGKGGLW